VRDSARAAVAPIQVATPHGPVFRIEPTKAVEAAHEFRAALPGVDVFYAMKANPEPAILAALRADGCGFEAASWGEIERLLSLGVCPDRIIFGTAVKARRDVARAFAAGVRRYAADAREELSMLAETASGSRVFIRAKVDDGGSVFQLSAKFGAPPERVAGLVLLARDFGLEPWGVSVNVGSQSAHPDAWADAVRAVAPCFRELSAAGVALDVLNLGGGFPVAYADGPDISLAKIGASLEAALGELPHRPQLIVEPGRRLAAAAATLRATVISRVERDDGPWLFLDCGVYNALYEALSHQGRTRYPVACEDRAGPELSFVLAGPTGDGLDIIARNVRLPAGTTEGDRLRFSNVGAYTLCMSSAFNGVPVPAVVVL
jgi:ornithine decarboxylase